MKKFIAIAGLILLSAFAFSGCGTDSTSSSTTTVTPGQITTYENADLAIDVAADWETFEKNNLPSEIPSYVVAVFRSNIKNEIFTSNVGIIKRELSEHVSSEDYAKKAMLDLQDKVTDFKEISGASGNVNKGEGKIPSYLVEFEGKRSPQDPLVKFRQLYVVDGVNAYSITASYAPVESESVVNSANKMLDSFRLK